MTNSAATTKNQCNFWCQGARWYCWKKLSLQIGSSTLWLLPKGGQSGRRAGGSVRRRCSKYTALHPSHQAAPGPKRHPVSCPGFEGPHYKVGYRKDSLTSASQALAEYTGSLSQLHKVHVWRKQKYFSYSFAVKKKATYSVYFFLFIVNEGIC